MRGACSQGVGDSRNSAVKGPENEAVTGGGTQGSFVFKACFVC